MLEDEDRYQPVNVQDIADALVFVLLEVARAYGGPGPQASEGLERIANELIESGRQLQRSNVRSIILATAQGLIETESGLFD